MTVYDYNPDPQLLAKPTTEPIVNPDAREILMGYMMEAMNEKPNEVTVRAATTYERKEELAQVPFGDKGKFREHGDGFLVNVTILIEGGYRNREVVNNLELAHDAITKENIEKEILAQEVAVNKLREEIAAQGNELDKKKALLAKMTTAEI